MSLQSVGWEKGIANFPSVLLVTGYIGYVRVAISLYWKHLKKKKKKVNILPTHKE